MKLGMCLSDSDWDLLAKEVSALVDNSFDMLKLKNLIHFRHNGNVIRIRRHNTMECGPDAVELIVDKTNDDSDLYWVTSSEELFEIIKEGEGNEKGN